MMTNMFYVFLYFSAVLFFFISCVSMFFMVSNYQVLSMEWTMWGAPSANIPVVLVFDKLSCLMWITVSIISLSVLLFSKYYMEGDKNSFMFYIILFFFIMSMLLLVLSPGLFSLFLGWDGLGLTSFLLVMFYSNSKSLTSSILTVLSNRAGDAMMLSALSLSAYTAMASNPTMTTCGGFSSEVMYLMMFFMVGVSTKSAQLPFSAWLPAAMAAPTPVSALVHSSTLVTAGVYVLIRFSPMLFNHSPYLLLIGVMTTLSASLSALGEEDMKKMIALSTLSQLGIMVTAIGAKMPILSFVHLVSHAFFKALMFIGAGDLIHTAGGYQDLKAFGGSSFTSPVSSSFLISAKAALCGLPFFSGFFSKEMIIENMLTLASFSYVSYFFTVMSALLTVMYSCRFIVKVMLGTKACFLTKSFPPIDPFLVLSMMALLVPGVGGGVWASNYFMQDLVISLPPVETKFFILSGLAMLPLFMWVASSKKTVFLKTKELFFFMWQSPSMSASSSLLKILTEKSNSITLNLFLWNTMHMTFELFSAYLVPSLGGIMKNLMRGLALAMVFLIMVL